MPSEDDVQYVLKRRFPEYTEAMRAAIHEAIKENPGHDDTSDAVLDAVWCTLDDTIDEGWPKKEPGEEWDATSAPMSPCVREKLRRLIDQARTFEADLWEMDHAQFQQLYAEASEKEQQEQESEGRARDQRNFFNKPKAAAQFEHWKPLPNWTVDEAVALSFGKEPTVVNPERLEAYLKMQGSPFARAFERRRDFVARAVQAGELEERMAPSAFVSWANRNGIDLPAELRTGVLDRGARLEEWKRQYKEQISALEQERDTLQAQVNQLQKERALDPNERRSVMKLILGLAMAHYNHNPDSGRTRTASAIHGKLRTVGISLNEDTIRKWLQEASREVPPDSADDGAI